MFNAQFPSRSMRFFRGESGAVAVEWMAVNGILFSFAIAVVSIISEPAVQLVDKISRAYEGDPEGFAAVAAGGSYTFDAPGIDTSAGLQDVSHSLR